VSVLVSNTIGNSNTAIGIEALESNTSGSNNTASGASALQSNTTGSNNIALGVNAGFNLTSGKNNIDIGNTGVAGEAAKIRIGTKGTQKAAFIAGISGVAVSGGTVVVNLNGQLGIAGSSARFKKEIRPMTRSSEALFSLKPVTFRYKEELDPAGIPQFGLVAEDVEKVAPDLVLRDEDGELMSVRYEAVNAMLLNEFLKEHQKVETQEAKLAEQDRRIAEQEKQIERLNVGLQQVAARIKLEEGDVTRVADSQ